MIGQTGGKLSDNLASRLHLPQQQHPPIAGDDPAIKLRLYRSPSQVLKLKPICRTLCLHLNAPFCSDNFCSKIHLYHKKELLSFFTVRNPG
jgi:hypothetical protein